jgi:hypothetical protein
MTSSSLDGEYGFSRNVLHPAARAVAVELLVLDEE